MIIICMTGFLLTGIFFFQLNAIIPILLVGSIFYFFSYPVSALGDSLGQRRADELNISFGSIRMWGSIGFAVSSLAIGEVLNQVGIQYIMWRSEERRVGKEYRDRGRRECESSERVR